MYLADGVKNEHNSIPKAFGR